jgi:hypothetical protein
MSDSSNASPTVGDIPLLSPHAAPSSPLVRLAGFLGIAGSALGICALLAGCAGFGGALAVSPVLVGLGALGLLLTLIGALTQHRQIGEDTHVLQAVFICAMCLIGGVLEMAVWREWPIFK